MSDFCNSKRVKLSSIESGIKPEDEDEASAVEEKQPIASCSGNSNQKTPKDASEAATVTATSDTSTGNALVEDVLLLIFENDFLDTTDLLQFRLVNRRWRDAATSVLLRSSACQISLNIRWVPIPSTVKFDAKKAFYCNNQNPHALLEDLNEIISQSPKFPCSSFRFVNSYHMGDVHYKNKIDTSSLHNLFSVYGNNIKTIIVGHQVLKSNLCSLLLNYAPNLECLDLRNFSFGDRDPRILKQPLLPKSTILPKLKTLILGKCDNLILKELINAAINLESVENTNEFVLRFLLENGKVGLIKTLDYYLRVRDLEMFCAFEKLSECQPKLTKLVVFAGGPTTVGDHSIALRGHFSKVQGFLNIILESSKDTLKYLEFRICPFADIKFPILKNLECLKLFLSNDKYGVSTRPSRSANEVAWLGQQNVEFAPARENNPFQFLNEFNARIYRFFPNRPCNSFPNLKKVQLDIPNYGIESDSSLLLLRMCRSHNRIEVVPHVYNSVEVLEIHSLLPKTIHSAKSVSNLFPNVTILKLDCTNVQELNCSLWVVSPLAKSIEIYGLCNKYHSQEGGQPSRSHDETDRTRELVLVDSFFTGFSIEMCMKLNNEHVIPIEIKENPSLQNFIRVKPSICDLKHLTDFKILFIKLRDTFASHVTGFYAFGNMPRTKITFAHAAPSKCNEAKCGMEKYLAPISAFVHFTHRNLPKRFDNQKFKDLSLKK